MDKEIKSKRDDSSLAAYSAVASLMGFIACIPAVRDATGPAQGIPVLLFAMAVILGWVSRKRLAGRVVLLLCALMVVLWCVALISFSAMASR